MKKSSYPLFTIAAFAISCALVIFAAPRASTLPDGLEWTAAKFGFSQNAKTAATNASPANNKSSSGVNKNKSNAISGVAGVSAVFLAAWGAGLLLKRRKHNGEKETRAA